MSLLLEVSTWAEFRDLCFITKNLNNQFTETASSYDLYGPDSNGLTWHINLRKAVGENPADEGVSQFEATYKSLCNYAIGARPYAFSTPDFQFEGDGIAFVATAGETTPSDFKILTAGAPGLYIDGGDFYTANSKVGDWIEVKVVDVDGLVSPAGTVLNDWVKKWYVSPSGNQSIRTPYAGKIPGGLYLRVVYHSVGPADVDVALNLMLHLGI